MSFKKLLYRVFGFFFQVFNQGETIIINLIIVNDEKGVFLS